MKITQHLKTHSTVISVIFLIFLWLTALAMFLIISFGLYHIGNAIYTFLFGTLSSETSKGNVLIEILHGLEFVFVSPIFYLLVLSLTKYVMATKPEIDPDTDLLNKKRTFMRHSMLEFINVKVFTVGLFISLLILHALKLILEGSMNVNSIIYIGALAIILLRYYVILDRVAEKSSSHS